jgi:tetratricopeptide (TPR) repeat protein
VEGETPLLRSWLGVLYARAGDHAAARSCIKRLEEIARQNVVGASDFAGVYAVLGENEKAIAWLEEGLRLRDPGMSFVPASHFFDGLRDDPRFASVVKRIGLAETRPARVYGRPRGLAAATRHGSPPSPPSTASARAAP